MQIIVSIGSWTASLFIQCQRSCNQKTMRPTIARFISIIPRSSVPSHSQSRVVPPIPRPSEQAPLPTLVDYLNAKREQRTKEYEEAQQRAQENDSITVDAVPWPKNLRIEPIVKRDVLAGVSREHRMALKDALKER